MMLAEKQSEKARKDVADNKEIACTLRRLLELALPYQRFEMTDTKAESSRVVDQLSDSIEINQTIVASVTALVVADDGTIIGATRAADLLFGYAIGELAGASMSIHDLVPADRREAHRKYFADFWRSPSARQMGTRGMQLQGVSRDGSVFQIEVGWGTPIFVLGRRAVVASVMKTGSHDDSGINL